MGMRKRRSGRALRGVLKSPDRPPVARREDQRRPWALIAAGLSSEIAAGIADELETALARLRAMAARLA